MSDIEEQGKVYSDEIMFRIYSESTDVGASYIRVSDKGLRMIIQAAWHNGHNTAMKRVIADLVEVNK